MLPLAWQPWIWSEGVYRAGSARRGQGLASLPCSLLGPLPLGFTSCVRFQPTFLPRLEATPGATQTSSCSAGQLQHGPCPVSTACLPLIPSRNTGKTDCPALESVSMESIQHSYTEGRTPAAGLCVQTCSELSLLRGRLATLTPTLSPFQSQKICGLREGGA